MNRTKEELEKLLKEKDLKLTSLSTLLEQYELAFDSVKDTLRELAIELNGENRERAKELLKQLKSYHLDASNKQDFLTHFERVHPYFYSYLNQEFPQLNKNDLRFCAYIKMQLSTKEIAQLQNVEVETVWTKRYRLRKKMRLEETIDLDDFLQSI